MFKAWIVTKADTKQTTVLTQLDEGQLPQGDVTVRVVNSSINYKDALALTGKAPIVRRFPMVPGVDLAGIVEQSTDHNYRPGDKVIVNGWEIGEVHWGGLAELARLRSEWLMRLPEPLTFFDAMAIGTAGYTAMLAVMALEKFGVDPDKGEILVTGAGGGVGGFAISFLAKLGYQVVASTGRLQENAYLKSLGATEVIDRAQFSGAGKALGKERWAGAIDNVGSHTLANVCAALKRGGAVASCGNAQGMDFPGTVAPFILRGVTLIGIDSNLCPMPIRLVAWDRIARAVDRKTISEITQTRPLSEAMTTAEEVLAGKIRGRVVIDINALRSSE
jgi:acrylyl-CoA reductase (NADPH)